MKLFNWTIHKGDCPLKIRKEIVYREGKDRRSDSQRMLDLGHKPTCVRVHYPNALHPCDCGLE